MMAVQSDAGQVDVRKGVRKCVVQPLKLQNLEITAQLRGSTVET